MRIQSFIAAAAASVIVVAMGAVASIAGYMSSRADGAAHGAVPVAVAARRLDRGCPDCGVVMEVRSIELKGRKVDPARVTTRYQIQVRMSDGSVKTLTYSSAPAWKAGDRVRLQNGRLVG
jgi:outer membrane lipoprotein SlyB